MKKAKLSFLMVICFSIALVAQKNAEPSWISFPSANVSDYGVYHFRKAYEINEIPDKLIIHISADNRYNLFVNGQRVCYGPAKGDLSTYKYDVIDIAPFLQEGNNQLAALVYNGGKDKPLAFLSVQTAFFLKAEDPSYGSLDTDSSWKVYKNRAVKPISYNEMLFKKRWFYGFYACGAGDEVDAALYPWGWEQAGFDDSTWDHAELLCFEGNPPWKLVPRNIAFMDNHLEYPVRIRKAEGLSLSPGKWEGREKIIVPASTSATLLIDFNLFTMGYPELKVSGGKNSSIKVRYAEALYEGVNLKAHRDSVEGLTMFGVWDIFHPDGEEDRVFRPLWKRAFRYVQIEIMTGDYPLELSSYINEYSGYPYPEMSTFSSDNKRLNEIFEMCLQTFRMCSAETYYDTPFYEQLSYGGDNRPISAISVYNSSDDRLFREMMRLYPQSENKETGLFKSAYPSRFTFDMGSWSLAWIQSLHDYYLMRGDQSFVSQFTHKIEGVLDFYERHLDESTGLIGTVKNQNFMDWSISEGSLPRSNEKKEMQQSTMLSLYFAHSADCAARIFKEIGEPEKATKWDSIASSVKKAVAEICWSEKRQLFRDYPDQEIYSQHSNVLAILCDVVPPAQQKEFLQRILSENNFDEMASSYFSFFLFKAMQKTGLEDMFLEHLDFWYAFLDRGFTTCGETGFASHDRSDCHAWSAHPAYFLLNTVCGIKPADIGFENVRIRPHLGDLSRVEASVPHPKGKISVIYELEKRILKAEIILPEGMSGNFEYKNQVFPLKEGRNSLKIKN